MNPELQRNLWLEVTPHRLWMIPLVLLATAALTWPPGETLMLTALVGFTMIWGPRQAADAVIDEARERTWDIQRMASLHPWSMTWGKLAGATVMSWYGAAWCGAILLAAAAPDEREERLTTVVIVVLSALTAQGLAMIAALVGMHFERKIKSRLSNAVAITLLIALMWNKFSLFDSDTLIAWYGFEFPRLGFTIISLLQFAAWAVLGAHRAMCMELKARTQPWVWLAFTAYAAVYLVGFQFPVGAAIVNFAPRLLSTAALVAGVQTYVAAFAFARDPIAYSRALRAFNGGAWRRTLEEIPVWFASGMACLLLAAGALLLGTQGHIVNTRMDNIGPGAFALALMMARDIALLHYFSFRPDGRRAAATTLIYIAVIDGLAPLLLMQLGLSGAVGFIRPSVLEQPWFAIGVFGAHAALAVTLASAAWRQTTAPQPTS